MSFTQRILYNAWLVKMSLLERRRWRKKRDKISSIQVYYGQDHIPRPDEPASGGVIKCQDLHAVFPNDPVNPNLLYLVSSNLPSHLPVLIPAAKRARAPIVLNQNGVAYPAWHGEGWEKTNQRLSLAHSAADYIFYQSRFCLESAFRFLGKATDRFEVLPNPVDTGFFTPDSSGETPLFPVLLTAGSHNSFYRLQLAVDIMKSLIDDHPSVRLIVAGRFRWGKSEAGASSEIRQYVRDCGVADRVEWFGPYSQMQAPDLFRRGDILLHATYNDACPRLVVEAMSCGLPVVYSASGGVPELVGDKAGIGVPAPFDWDKIHPPSLADLLEATKMICKYHAEYSAAARKRAVEMFDVKTWIQRHREIFTRLLNSGL